MIEMANQDLKQCYKGCDLKSTIQKVSISKHLMTLKNCSK
jgi:hypothetical protein